MKIKVADRFYPFSHKPGVQLLVPKTTQIVQIFPKRLVHPEGVYLFPFEGPLKGFTVIQDLEKEYLRFFGQNSEKYMEGTLFKKEGGVYLKWKDKEEILLFKEACPLPLLSLERLSLGSNKKQEWERVIERRDLAEILPTWFRLHSLTPPVLSERKGTARLLTVLEDAVQSKDICSLEEHFLSLFHAGFSGILAPRWNDFDFQGIIEEEEILSTLPPSVLITEGGRIIRSLFLQEEANKISLLPALPPSLHAGRFVNLKCSFGEMDLEWSKKTLRRVCLRVHSCQPLELILPPSLKRFRLRKGKEEKGNVLECPAQLLLTQDQVYFLDSFQK